MSVATAGSFTTQHVNPKCVAWAMVIELAQVSSCLSVCVDAISGGEGGSGVSHSQTASVSMHVCE